MVAAQRADALRARARPVDAPSSQHKTPTQPEHDVTPRPVSEHSAPTNPVPEYPHSSTPRARRHSTGRVRMLHLGPQRRCCYAASSRAASARWYEPGRRSHSTRTSAPPTVFDRCRRSVRGSAPVFSPSRRPGGSPGDFPARGGSPASRWLPAFGGLAPLGALPAPVGLASFGALPAPGGLPVSGRGTGCTSTSFPS